MEQVLKRSKVSEETLIAAIAASIDSLSDSIKSIGDTHYSLLQANKIVVGYVQEAKEKKNRRYLDTLNDPDNEKSN